MKRAVLSASLTFATLLVAAACGSQAAVPEESPRDPHWVLQVSLEAMKSLTSVMVTMEQTMAVHDEVETTRQHVQADLIGQRFYSVMEGEDFRLEILYDGFETYIRPYSERWYTLADLDITREDLGMEGDLFAFHLPLLEVTHKVSYLGMVNHEAGPAYRVRLETTAEKAASHAAALAPWDADLAFLAQHVKRGAAIFEYTVHASSFLLLESRQLIKFSFDGIQFSCITLIKLLDHNQPIDFPVVTDAPTIRATIR